MTERINSWGRIFLREKFQLFNEGNRKVSLEHHPHNCCKQGPWMDTNMRMQKSEENRILHNLKVSPQNIFNYKGKSNNFRVELEQIPPELSDQGYYHQQWDKQHVLPDIILRRTHYFCHSLTKKA